MGVSIAFALGAIMGAVCVLLVVTFNKPQGQKRKQEFSKLVLTLVLSTYFIGAAVGLIIDFVDVTQLGVVLAFIGAPTATAIAFYCWKAKAENLIKIKQKYPQILDSPLDLENITT